MFTVDNWRMAVLGDMPRYLRFYGFDHTTLDENEESSLEDETDAEHELAQHLAKRPPAQYALFRTRPPLVLGKHSA